MRASVDSCCYGITESNFHTFCDKTKTEQRCTFMFFFLKAKRQKQKEWEHLGGVSPVYRFPNPSVPPFCKSTKDRFFSLRQRAKNTLCSLFVYLKCPLHFIRLMIINDMNLTVSLRRVIPFGFCCFVF